MWIHSLWIIKNKIFSVGYKVSEKFSDIEVTRITIFQQRTAERSYKILTKLTWQGCHRFKFKEEYYGSTTQFNSNEL